MTNWNSIKFNFLEFIDSKNINTFVDFHNELKSLETKVKGEYFEYFCKLYFNIDIYSKQHYNNFYLYTDIPDKIKKQLKVKYINQLIII